MSVSKMFVQDLDADLQFLIAAHAKPHKVAAGHQICAEGAPADCIWMLHEGELCIKLPTFVYGKVRHNDYCYACLHLQYGQSRS
jgi:CRP-like cAMP-binding protein